jgi:hypothetical protein
VTLDSAFLYSEEPIISQRGPPLASQAGEAQWYCSGKDFEDTWHVNVGPYGEITYP